MGAHGWVVGIASHGSILLSRGWLITVEALGHPRHPPPTKLDAVINFLFLIFDFNYWRKMLLVGLQ